MSTTLLPNFISSIPIYLPGGNFTHGQLPPNTTHKHDLIQDLTQLRALFKEEMLYRDIFIRQTIYPNNDSIVQQDISQSGIDVITDLDTQPLLFSQISSIVSSSTPSLLAELRAWQEAAHTIACIDTAISYISGAITQEADSLTDRICDIMMATIIEFHVPQGPRPAQQRLDDRERVMDRPVFYDEPQMRILIASFDDGSRLLLKAAADRERSRLPLFPPYLSGTK